MKNKYVKSPLNYVGGKYKLLPQILTLFPENIDTFYDLFCGGCNVGVNAKANNIVCNDMIQEIIELFKNWRSNELDVLVKNIEDVIIEYNLSQSSVYGYEYYGCNSNDGLSSYNRESWQQLRKRYNKTKDIKLLYPLIIFTFNNHIKFDKSGNFTAGGCNKRDFNDSLKKRFVEFISRIYNINIKFSNMDFRHFKTNKLKENDFLYCDPPYLNTNATYNENGGWGREEENALLNLLKDLDSRNIKWALSNNISINTELKVWAEELNYNIHYLNHTYNNSNYHKKDKESKDLEVLITNY